MSSSGAHPGSWPCCMVVCQAVHKTECRAYLGEQRLVDAEQGGSGADECQGELQACDDARVEHAQDVAQVAARAAMGCPLVKVVHLLLVLWHGEHVAPTQPTNWLTTRTTRNCSRRASLSSSTSRRGLPSNVAVACVFTVSCLERPPALGNGANATGCAAIKCVDRCRVHAPGRDVCNRVCIGRPGCRFLRYCGWCRTVLLMCGNNCGGCTQCSSVDEVSEQNSTT